MYVVPFLPSAPAPIFWLVVMVGFAVLEGLTVGLASIWFAVGALAAALLALVCGSFWIQVVAFGLVSLLTLLLVRPLTARYFQPKDHTPTNADSLIGREGRVTVAIDNLSGMGQVRVGGQVWTARSESGAPIAEGCAVQAVRIEGVRLYVRPVE